MALHQEMNKGAGEWYYGNMQKEGYKEGMIKSLMNNFDPLAYDRAKHGSAFDPVTMTVEVMFRADDEEQNLAAMEEEFGVEAEEDLTLRDKSSWKSTKQEWARWRRSGAK